MVQKSGTMKKYDLCVIGAGPAGYAATMRALDLKKTVLLLEKDKVGGVGLYNGALSSKTFWEVSTEIASVRKRLHKYSSGELKINFKEILSDVNDALLPLFFGNARAGHVHGIAGLSETGWPHNGVLRFGS